MFVHGRLACRGLRKDPFDHELKRDSPTFKFEIIATTLADRVSTMGKEILRYVEQPGRV